MRGPAIPVKEPRKVPRKEKAAQQGRGHRDEEIQQHGALGCVGGSVGRAASERRVGGRGDQGCDRRKVEGGTLTEEEDVERDYGVDRSRGPKAVPLPGLPPLVLPLIRVVQTHLNERADQTAREVESEEPPSTVAAPHRRLASSQR